MFVLTPGDSRVQDSKSDPANGNFGGNRKVTANIQRASDYTLPTTGNSEAPMNPVEETVRDVDDLNDAMAKKNETKRQEDLKTAGDTNPLNPVTSGPYNKPLDEGREDSAFQVPDEDDPHGSLSPNNPYFL